MRRSVVGRGLRVNGPRLRRYLSELADVELVRTKRKARRNAAYYNFFGGFSGIDMVGLRKRFPFPILQAMYLGWRWFGRRILLASVAGSNILDTLNIAATNSRLYTR